MTRVLLVNSPTFFVGRRRPVFPLGLASLGTVLLNEHACRVDLLDMNLPSHPFQALEDALRDLRPEVVGVSWRNAFMFGHPQVGYLARTVATVRREVPHARIACGAPGAALFAPALMQALPQIDLIVIAEGEPAAPALLGEDPARFGGVVYRRDGAVHDSPMAPARPDMDRLPLPIRAWANLDLDRYPMLNLQSSRGCPHRCGYCPTPHLQGSVVRTRPLEAIQEELEMIASTSGPRPLFVTDPAPDCGPAGRVASLAELMARHHGEGWVTFIKTEGLTAGLLEALKASRAGTLILSVDTGSPRLARSLSSTTDPQEILPLARRLAASFGRGAVFCFMIGLPGEGAADLIRTGALMARLRGMGITVTLEPLLLLPETPLAGQIGRPESSDSPERPSFASPNLARLLLVGIRMVVKAGSPLGYW